MLPMAKVVLKIYPPLSRKIASKKVGALVLEEEIEQGETLRDLLARLASGDSEAWAVLFDLQTRQIKPYVVTVFNGVALPVREAFETRLSDGDKITFLPVYGGG